MQRQRGRVLTKTHLQFSGDRPALVTVKREAEAQEEHLQKLHAEERPEIAGMSGTLPGCREADLLVWRYLVLFVRGGDMGTTLVEPWRRAGRDGPFSRVACHGWGMFRRANGVWSGDHCKAGIHLPGPSK